MIRFTARKRATAWLVAGLAGAFALTGGIVTPASSAPMASAAASAETSRSAVADGFAPRISTPAGGGHWSYGTTSSTVYSNYQHAKKVHRSTACADGGRCARSNWKDPGVLASAVRPKSKGGNTAFWDVA